MRNHVIISGTGRAGTTFLVQLFTALKFDTGFEDVNSCVFSNCNAGMEFDLRQNTNAPYIVKDPALCDYLDELLDSEGITIDLCIIPIRDLYSAAESRRDVTVRTYEIDDSGVVAGGVWHTDNPEEQENILSLKLYNLIYTVVKRDIPVSLIHFPRFVNDPEYLYHKIKSVFKETITYDVFFDSYKSVVRPDLVHSFDKTSISDDKKEIFKSYNNSMLAQLQVTQSYLEQTQSQLEQTQQRIKEMESSKFWKLRNAWFKIKNVNTDIEILSNLCWKDDSHLTINDVSFNLSCDTKELQTNTSSKDSFLLGKPRHLVEKAVAISHKEKIKKIFEMGILQGGSVVLYDQIFQPQVIAAIEYSAEPVNALTEYIAKYKKGSIVKPYYGVNQADRSAMGKILSSEFPRKDIDLIIDDASHLYKETKEAFNISFPYLRKGGLYIIEDWAWAHWSGDYWQNGQTPGLAGKDAMSNLLIELFMLAASRPDFISDISVEHSTITVRKGTGDLPKGDFDISEHYLLRGKGFDAWL